MKEEAARTLHGGIGKTAQTRSNPVKPNQGESNQIKANQTCGVVGVSQNWTIRCESGRQRGTGQTQSNRIKPSQTIKGLQESEQIKNGPLYGLLAPPEKVNSGQTQSNSIKVNQTKSNQIKPARGGNWPKLDSAAPKEGGGTPHGQTPSKRVKPGFCSKKSSYGSTELPYRLKSNPIKPNQTCQREKLAEIGLGGAERWWRNTAWSNPIKAGQARVLFQEIELRLDGVALPSQVKPNQTESNLPEGEIGRNWARRCRKMVAEHRMVKPNQTGSNPVKLRDSQESEQIQNGPLRGQLLPPEGSNRVKPEKVSSSSREIELRLDGDGTNSERPALRAVSLPAVSPLPAGKCESFSRRGRHMTNPPNPRNARVAPAQKQTHPPGASGQRIRLRSCPPSNKPPDSAFVKR